MSLNRANLDSGLSYQKQGFMAHYQEESVKMQRHASSQFTMLFGVLAAYLYWLLHRLVLIISTGYDIVQLFRPYYARHCAGYNHQMHMFNYIQMF